MAQFIIRGGKKLAGTIPVFGSKNAAGPAIAAALLARGASRVDNIPRIGDVLRMVGIAQSLGSTCSWRGAHTLRLDAARLALRGLDQTGVKQLRSSVLLVGAALGRFRKISLLEPGGCNIGARPLDTHLQALRDFGTRISRRGTMLHFDCRNALRASRTIVLRELSVTATENLLMLAVATVGTTIIKIAATEPHVQDLCAMLQKMGAGVEGAGTHTLVVRGKRHLKPFRHTLIPDPIEAGTFLILGALIGKQIFVKNARPDHLDLVIETLRDFGVQLASRKDGIAVKGGGALRAHKLEFQPYPALPSDLQAVFGVLATQARGTSLLHDKLYEDRFRYLAELNRMGARAVQCDPHRAVIAGPTPLSGTHIKSLDLRAGATLVMAGLIARGTTEIEDIEQVDRGYERLEERLIAVGARITRVGTPASPASPAPAASKRL